MNISNYIPLPKDLSITTSLLTLGFIPFIWVIGHLTAVSYFNSFGVNYAHIASLDSGLIFAVQHMSGLLKSLFIIVLVLHFLWISFYPSPTQNVEQTLLQKAKNIGFALIRVFITFTLMSLIFGAGSGQLGEALADKDKEKIGNLGYHFSTITLEGGNTISCAYLWGDISDFSLILSFSGSHQLIHKSMVRKIVPTELPSQENMIVRQDCGNYTPETFQIKSIGDQSLNSFFYKLLL